jgi:uncharacterized protein with beta-barrel porin domain
MNKKNWLGMLVMVLVFGMTVVGCGAGKKITITGLSGKTGTISVGLMTSVLTSEIIAGGTVKISGDSATITLNNPDGTPWTGSGSFYLYLDLNGADHMYTKGKTLSELGISDDYDLDRKVPLYNITSTKSTVAYNDFMQ